MIYKQIILLKPNPYDSPPISFFFLLIKIKTTPVITQFKSNYKVGELQSHKKRPFPIISIKETV